MKCTVLVVPGGTEIGLEVAKALNACREITLIAANAECSNHAPYVFAECAPLPQVGSVGWLDCWRNFVVSRGIDAIFPCHDDVVLALANHVVDFPAKIITSPYETCRIARSKRATYDHFANCVRVPQILGTEPDTFPVFVKPDMGQGSQHAQLVTNREMLHALVAERNDLLVMEYLPGEEFTIDCFSDRDKGLLYCNARQRIRTRSGISFNTRFVDSRPFESIANTIQENVKLAGAWFFQMKRDVAGELTLLEFAPRIAGAMAIDRVIGVNLPLLSLYEAYRMPFTIKPNSFDVELDRALINRYRHSVEYRTVYVDYDDFIIHRGKLNTEVIRFLYQCLNQEKRIILLTRHRGDIQKSLRARRILELFDEIVLVPTERPKSDYITDPVSIFLDDSFSERLSVAMQLAIPTFDASSLEVLLDDRR